MVLLSFIIHSKRPPHERPQFSFLCFRDAVRDIVLEKFAGPYDKGEYSPSVQKTLCDIQVLSLSRVPEVRFVVSIVRTERACCVSCQLQERVES